MSLKKPIFSMVVKRKCVYTQLLIFLTKDKKPPPDVPLRGFAKLSTLKRIFFEVATGQISWGFFRLCLSLLDFFGSPKRTLSFDSQDNTKEILKLSFSSTKKKVGLGKIEKYENPENVNQTLVKINFTWKIV